MANWSLKRNEATREEHPVSPRRKPQVKAHAHDSQRRNSMVAGSGTMAEVEIVKFPTRAAVSYPSSSMMKRGLDIIGGLLLLAALAPVMLVIALLVKRDGGTAMFSHKRIGANGKPFYCLKFRTMCVDAEARLQKVLAENAAARAEWERDFKLKDDPRVTSLGAVMRATSLDELPQLINVIKGEMSLVGPRPIVSAEASRYGAAFRDYLGCRPGLTGLWQVSGRNDIDYEARVRLDSTYAREWSFCRDISILARTVGAVLGRTGY